MRGRILVVDDDTDMTETIAAALSGRGYEARCSQSGDDALAELEREDFDVVLTDLRMPGLSGVELCERIVTNRPGVLVVVLTAFGSMETAVAAIRAGAYDYLTKPFDFELLFMVLGRAMRVRAMTRELKRLRAQVASDDDQHPEILGDSAAITKLKELLARIADATASVMITGESGTGKERVARTLHRQSGRPGKFVGLNCAAVPEALLESELFGHVAGAFTDAHQSRIGLFRQAEKGTLFLDEVGELSAALQAKLLRALQERTVRPIGGHEEHAWDARILAATNADLERAVAEGRFREDLYYRLNVIHVMVPPLRARNGDILLLAHHFLEQFVAETGRDVKDISHGAAERLLAYNWPGNVRELENCVNRAVTMARFESVLVEDLPEKVRNYTASHVVTLADAPADLIALDEVERRHIRRVMDVVAGNKSLAAKILGLDRKTLYRRMERLGLKME